MSAPPRPRSRRAAVALMTLATAVTTACTESSNNLMPEMEDPTPEEIPTVVSLAPASLPSFDTDTYKATCQTPSGECPVVRWEGVDYVALSFRDNRSAFAVHAFDAAGATLGVREETGARYLAAVQIDAEARAVVFVGQAERSVTLGWEALRGIR